MVYGRIPADTRPVVHGGVGAVVASFRPAVLDAAAKPGLARSTTSTSWATSQYPASPISQPYRTDCKVARRCKHDDCASGQSRSVRMIRFELPRRNFDRYLSRKKRRLKVLTNRARHAQSAGCCNCSGARLDPLRNSNYLPSWSSRSQSSCCRERAPSSPSH
jgi:hypothetical protein